MLLQYFEFCLCTVSDFLTGIYLLGVCYHNEKFKGRYSKFAIDWVYSDKCKALGIIGEKNYKRILH